MTTPTRLTFTKKRPKFAAWLVEAGAEMLVPTNEWELMRFRGDKGTSVVYRDKAGNLTFTGEVGEAWKRFTGGVGYRVTQAAKRRQFKSPEIKALMERDGSDCFYCLSPLGEDLTVEHLLAVTHGGPSHISNLALAHRECNEQAHHLSLMEKIRMRTEAVIAMRHLGRKAA